MEDRDRDIKGSPTFILGQITNELKSIRHEIKALKEELEKNKLRTWKLNKKFTAIWTFFTLGANYLISNPSIILKLFKM